MRWMVPWLRRADTYSVLVPPNLHQITELTRNPQDEDHPQYLRLRRHHGFVEFLESTTVDAARAALRGVSVAVITGVDSKKRSGMMVCDDDDKNNVVDDYDESKFGWWCHHNVLQHDASPLLALTDTHG